MEGEVQRIMGEGAETQGGSRQMKVKMMMMMMMMTTALHVDLKESFVGKAFNTLYQEDV